MADEWTATRIRKTFLDFFQERDHTIVPSASVVPHNDPTLLFINSGMCQFKPLFLGTVSPTDPFANLKRATDTQRVLRAGGKHNDLDDVGKDSYHHTAFEMLGNWSFGDYGPTEAITMAWELLTKVYGLNPKRLYCTYFEGLPSSNLPPDLETKELWKSVGVPEDQIVPGNMKDNFWEMGDQGPCGPCTELHYWLGPGEDNKAELVNADSPELIEIWNLVFIKYNREADKSLMPLPAQHVDTGLGFERLVSILQGKTSNYATDVFTPLFKRIQDVTGAREYTDKYGKDDVDGMDTAYRVVADHIRLLTWAISDGVAPNNDGRGYVVRRVLRRGARFARKYFNAEIGAFFSKILPAFIDQIREQFPDIAKKASDVAEILDEEEVAFSKTLDRGEAQFERVVAQAAKVGQTKLSGDVVWRLYDTYGFPFDLTVIMCEERGLTFDQAEVDAAREKAKEASKVVKENAKTFKPLNVHQLSELGTLAIPRTNDEAKFSKGDIKSKVILIVADDKFVKSTKDIPEGTPLGLLLDKTSFYAESGGQVADSGRIVIDDVAEFEVVDVQSYGSYILHNGFMKYGKLASGDEVLCEYDELRREPIRNNHTATHVINHSLREVLGDDVNQKGSIVDDGKLRFDFSHKTAVKIEELRRVEDMSNADIEKGLKVYSQDVGLDQAKQIEGLRAVFGETYPNPVRVVSIGMDIDVMLADPTNAEWRQYSVEFCGGTHVDQTGAIKRIVLVEESGIAKGIRRIVAYTGAAAADVQRKAAEMEKRIAELEALPFGPGKEQLFKQTTVDFNQLTISVLTKDELKQRLDKVGAGVLAEQKKRQKEELQSAVDTVVEHFAKHEDATWFVGQLPISANAKALMEVANHFKNKDKAKSVYVFGGSAEEGNVVHAVYVGTDLSSKGVAASQWAASVCEVIGGKSGGKEPLLQGRGTNPEKLEDAIATATKWVEEKLRL